MKAHKVPATYFDGWKASGYGESFYVFYVNDLTKPGILKKFRNVDKLTSEHTYFMEEDFYYINFSIPGIAFKLKSEITDFLTDSGYHIECIDDLVDSVEGGHVPMVHIDDYETFIKYMCCMDSWSVQDSNGTVILIDDFKAELDAYIFDKVGKVIEEQYFANYLEYNWAGIKESIWADLIGLNSGDSVNITRKNDLLEFFMVQYLRLDKRIKHDIEPVVCMVEDILKEMGADNDTILEMKNDGILTPEAYFFGILLDAARGEKGALLKNMSNIDMGYEIDVLKAPEGYAYLSSTSPCVFSEVVEGRKKEMLFPLDSKYCLRFRLKEGEAEKGKYIIQSLEELKTINNKIVNGSEDIVVSESNDISICI